MKGKKTGNNSFLKEYNQSRILDLVRVNTKMSRAELSAATGLYPTATGKVTAELISRGYIHEIGTGESTGGRKPVLLELKPESFFSIGMDIDVEHITTILIDITGKILYEKKSGPVRNLDFECMMDDVNKGLEDITARHPGCTGKLLGIGFSVPGLVDSKTQKIVFAPNLGWRNADLKPCLRFFPNIPVYVENEAMSSAICENWLGLCRGIDNFICINVQSGIGAGIFVHGRLYRGTGGTAGEIGHIVVDENGPKCGCGNYGCLETLASTTGIENNVRRLVRQGVVSDLNNIEDMADIELDFIIKQARQGDGTALNILQEAARYLGIAISNIVNTLNPEKIVLGKDFTKYADLVMDYMKEVVRRKALESPAATADIVSSQTGGKSSALGAAIIPLKKLFGKE